jgi:hypothetical protein
MLPGIMFFFPVILIVASVIEVAFFHNELWSVFKSQIYIRDFFVLNAIHLGLTFLFVYFSKEGKAWLRDFKADSPHINRNLLLVFTITFGLFYGYSSATINESRLIRYFPTWVIFCMQIYHSMKQTYGINLFIFKDRPVNLELKKLYTLGTFSYIGYYSYLFYFRHFLPLDFKTTLSVITTFLVVIFSVILIKIHKSSSTSRNQGLLFNLRLFLKPLSGWSALCAYLMTNVHYIEYIYVHQKLNPSISQKDGVKKILVVLFILFVFSITLFSYAYSFRNIGMPKNRSLLIGFDSIMAGVSVCHYYMDYCIFTIQRSASNKQVWNKLNETV